MEKLLLAASVVFACLQPGTEDHLPPNLDPGPFRSTVETMWELSPTFRQQCLRLAGARGLTVRIRADVAHPRGFARARTEISRTHGLVTFADVVLLDPRGPVELIGHEIEHVIEQLEGVQLSENSCSGNTSPISASESCRAIQAGRLISREVEQSSWARRLWVRSLRHVP